MSDTREQIDNLVKDSPDTLEAIRATLLSREVLNALIWALDIKCLPNGKIQVADVAGMLAALDAAGLCQRAQTFEDFIEGR